MTLKYHAVKSPPNPTQPNPWMDPTHDQLWAAAAILDFQVMWIWLFLRVDSVVYVLCAKFGSNNYDIVTEIDALMLLTFIWWRHAN